MRNNAESFSVRLTLRDDFDADRLSERELQPLRAFLPDLLRELTELSLLAEDEE